MTEQPQPEFMPARERFKGFLIAMAEEEARLTPRKQSILAELDLSEEQHNRRAEAWNAIIGVAMEYRNYRGPMRTVPRPIYGRVERLLQELVADRDVWYEAHETGLDGYPDALAELLSAATQALRERPKPAHQGIQRPVPLDCIGQLARVYFKATGKEPTASNGKFAMFVHQFWDALGNGRGYFTIVSDVKRWRRSFAS